MAVADRVGRQRAIIRVDELVITADDVEALVVTGKRLQR